MQIRRVIHGDLWEEQNKTKTAFYVPFFSGASLRYFSYSAHWTFFHSPIVY